jgi:DNA polymerase-2
MDPDPGIYRNVVVLDFRSLYPSIIMTFLIDPLGLVMEDEERVRTPLGTSFARKAAILPSIIKELMEARAEAKRTKNPYLSQAIKIIMNSFYGVLGTTGCRFFAEDLAQSITETGQHLFKTTVEHIQKTTGFRVIYGDTDSMFVLLGEKHDADGAEVGQEIARETTAWLAGEMTDAYATESALELQFECHFRHFLVPTVRGGSEGSKKHYCGALDRDGELVLVFKGMESARSDWTALAKEFQHELCRRVFTGEPVEAYVMSTVRSVREGKLDEKLVYRKRLRKDVSEYTANVPPHVQAARLLDEPVRDVRYCITLQGPQPLEKLTAALDYEHYVDSQLKPIADTLLELIGLSFDRIASGQQELFGP